MIPTNELLPYLSVLSIVLTVAMVVGGISAFRNGRQTQLAKFQSDTNTALQQRIEALEGRIADFEKENIIQRHIIDTITLALKQRGLIVTVDGDLVTITDESTGTSSHRKRLSDRANIKPPPRKEEP